MSSVQDNQIKAMLTLLTDSDERTVDFVKQTLVKLGQEAVPSLLRAGDLADPQTRVQLDSILEEIRLNRLEERFRRWVKAPDRETDLEEGVFLLAEFRFPDLSLESYQQRLDEMAQILEVRLNGITRPRSLIETINEYLFHEEGFTGNTQHYYDPDNSYLNRVLDRKTGIPISLSVVYLLLSRRLGLPVKGVGLPGHFILKFESEDFSTYLDVFNKGQALTRIDCVQYLRNSGYEVKEAYFDPVSNLEILLRMMRNLIYIYSQLKEDHRVRRLTRLIQILESSSREDLTKS